MNNFLSENFKWDLRRPQVLPFPSLFLSSILKRLLWNVAAQASLGLIVRPYLKKLIIIK
jgi:hypothetical protein